MNVTSLDVECKLDGSTKISCWVECHTLDDVNEVVEWLHLAADLMLGWREICDKRTAKPAASVTPIKRDTSS